MLMFKLYEDYYTDDGRIVRITEGDYDELLEKLKDEHYANNLACFVLLSCDAPPEAHEAAKKYIETIQALS